MITYILLAIFVAIILITTYYTFFLLKNSGGSLLYQRISGLGLLFILISCLSFVTIFQHSFEILALNYNFSLYSIGLQILVTYNFFRIWEIRHNQIAKTKYKSIMIILTLINLSLLFIKDQITFIGINESLINNIPIFLNVVLLINISLLFLRFNKLSSSVEFRFFPILISLISLLSVFIVLYNLQMLSQSGYFLSLLGQAVTYLLVMQFCISDFKKSFYYYKKI